MKQVVDYIAIKDNNGLKVDLSNTPFEAELSVKEHVWDNWDIVFQGTRELPADIQGITQEDINEFVQASEETDNPVTFYLGKTELPANMEK